MPRAPLQVIVIPCRQAPNGGSQFVVFHRVKPEMWQFISGGGESGESPEQAARREALEEAGIPNTRSLMKLDAMASIPRSAFPTSAHWPNDLFVVPEYSFAVDASDAEIALSCEHDSYEWVSYESAMKLLTWESNRVALWELNERLKRHQCVG
ncbi:MAG: NUDIX pyrophosphatase [Candidatus Accumulibacter propinquus]|jgi:dATP pyrophosphohydrolase